MAMLAAIAPIAQVIGAGVGALGTLAAGRQAKEAGEWQAREHERVAMAERAAAQREAEQVSRRADLAQSRLQTVAAASGLSATDPTALNLEGEIASHGDLQARMTRYGGEDRATGIGAQADMARYSGRAAQNASYYRAAGTILGGIGGLARYGGKPTGSAASSPYTFG
jgi:hypothetical protein